MSFGGTNSSKKPGDARLDTLEREVQALRNALRQIPSRFPVPSSSAAAAVELRVRFALGSDDLSEGEDVDSGDLVWIDGPASLAALRPTAFGDSVTYTGTLMGTETRSSEDRPLYRLTGYVETTGPNVSQLTYSGLGGYTVLDGSGVAITTTIDGVPGNNSIPLADDGFSPSVGAMWDWCHGRYSGHEAVADIGCTVNGVNSYITRGGVNSWFDEGGAEILGLTVNCQIDPGEPFRVEVFAASENDNSGSSPSAGAQAIAAAVFRKSTSGWLVNKMYGWSWYHLSDTSLATRARSRVESPGAVSSSTFVFYINDASQAAYTLETITVTVLEDSTTQRVTGVTVSSTTFGSAPFILNAVTALVTGGRSD